MRNWDGLKRAMAAVNDQNAHVYTCMKLQRNKIYLLKNYKTSLLKTLQHYLKLARFIHDKNA